MDNEGSTCSVEDCATQVRARGWCATHYSQWRRCGDPLWREEKQRGCEVSGCDRDRYGHGLCGLHYQRVRRAGSTELRQKVARFCSVDDCDRPLTPPHGRGMCSRHYQRWQKYGDPLGQRQLKVGVAPCAINGCDKRVSARQWCSAHYTRWVRHGDPLARMPGEVRNGRRICPTCEVDKDLSEWSKGECRPCSAARVADYRIRNPYVPVVGEPAECDCCGQTFMANARRSRYCSRECFVAYRHRANWVHGAKRRARMAKAFVESFDRHEIFERDGWICQLCQAPVNRSAEWPASDLPSLDHIIPISRGGEHSRANAQTACLGCNVRKGARLIA